MSYIVIDTETSGLPQCPGFFKLYNPSAWHFYSSARMIDLASVEYDSAGNEISSVNTLVIPEGDFYISDASKAVHGLSEEDLLKSGISTRQALKRFQSQLLSARKRNGISITLVGHHIAFDVHVIAAEAYRLGFIKLVKILCNIRLHCTMLANTALCGLKRPNGFPKWPKLSELWSHLFGDSVIDSQHTALGDANATAMCFFEIMRLHQYPNTRQKIPATGLGGSSLE
jgi:DNA polymerase-3 subunit epsilon